MKGEWQVACSALPTVLDDLRYSLASGWPGWASRRPARSARPKLGNKPAGSRTMSPGLELVLSGDHMDGRTAIGVVSA
eukprot:11483101-Alexandrium_andersonii.AAC.1